MWVPWILQLAGVSAFFWLAVGCEIPKPTDSSDPPESPSTKNQISIQLRPATEKNSKASFVVTGLSDKDLEELARSKLKPDEWAALFSVYVENAQKTEKTPPPPVLGAYRVERKALIFEPRFPLAPGVHYRAVLEPSRLPNSGESIAKTVVATFTIPKIHSTPNTIVEHVYPTADLLPENQLKFYIHFSAPMSKGDAYRHVHLIEAEKGTEMETRLISPTPTGKEIDLPFLRLDEELWNEKQTRFTLFFDPGRIKRGLKPREDVGPSLEEGKSYILVIDRDWTDAESNPLKESFRKSFRAGPPNDNPIDPKTWKVEPPTAGTRNPLHVRFPKPLDHALLERVLRITDAAGNNQAILEGDISVTDGETRWHFTPKQPWQPGSYNLTADTALEDLAGNSIGRPFEVDVFHPIQRQVISETIKIPFHVTSKD